ncbi:type II CAAX endopeptidase family protein [Clostridium sediminicola]|uniref:CPBP family intramembrane glutamic endopeptidase n=1 Tax=Clostridium sediminicola TaxID=3114879 RepID=UPI0031F2208B
MKKVFKNEDCQLRSGWKILITYVSFFVVTNIIAMIVFTAYSASVLLSAGGDISPEELTKLITENNMLNTSVMFIQVGIMILSVILFWKIFDKRPLKDLGLVNPLKSMNNLVYGLIFGAVSISLIFFFLLFTGQIEMVNSFLQPKITKWLIIDLVLFILVGFNEELFSRGYCITVLGQTKSRWVMILVSSLIFSAMHLLNPNVSYLGLLNIFLVGILFAIMFIKSGDLWMSIGYHITWNYFQGNIFGFNVSGKDVHGIYSLKYTTENIINGGKFGPEGGIITSIILIISIVFVIKYTFRENNIVEFKQSY